MKLTKCYVSSFGKLKDFTYDFNDNLNTIKEDNGWGKTTFATFIKAMFFGLNDSKRNVADNERTKYKPWNSATRFGGYLQFIHQGKEYKIERFFGNKEAEDTVVLYDISTGKTFNVKEDLGKKLFGVDEEGFLSTTYFSQKDFQVKSNTSLTAKYNQICEIQDSSAFDDAVKKLDEKAKTYKYRGGKGLIPDTKVEVYKIEQSIEQAKTAIDTANKLKEEAENLSIETQNIDKKIKEIDQKLTLAGRAETIKIKKERYDKLLKTREDIYAQKQPCQKVLNGNTVSVEEVNKYIACNNELSGVNTKIESLEQMVRELTEKQNQIPAPKKDKKPIIFAVISALFLIAGIVSVFFNTIIGCVLFGVSALCLIALIVTAILNKNKPVQDNGYLQLIEEKKKDILGFYEIKARYQQGIDAYLSRFNVSGDRNNRLQTILSASQRLIEIEKQESSVNQEVAILEKEQDVFKPLDLSLNAIQLNMEKSTLQREFRDKTIKLAELKAKAIKYVEYADSMPELEEEKQVLKDRISDYENHYSILTKTLEFLKLADENLKVKYRAPLQQSLNKYLSYISQTTSAVIDIDLTVRAVENDGEKSVDYYSKGYQNLFEICKRFALTDVLFAKEKPFMILDDPFYNLDDAKLKNSLELVEKLSSEYQIIYLVCHQSRQVENVL